MPFHSSRGQSSMDSLLVMGFVVVVAMIILVPFVQNQAITNAALTAKLAVLPYLNANAAPIHVDSIIPVTTATTIAVDVVTTGQMDSDTRASIDNVACLDICTQIRQSGAYAAATFSWTNNGNPSIVVCSPISC
ncbi:MAG: hypothetical protein IPJ89_00160 [Candidatus Iainarchaeum archaeon]|uniref:Uncharacterized protein n=1 Tax=Candidatus Iainarchaeum sp. TaxID=3101447 RepID=A0A7T9I226_9ARCH|nr:MAG: hypothetical protein IPJ89_00160 [Candidatus Diapherotrites archaeon]